LRALRPWLWAGLWASAVLVGVGQFGLLSGVGLLLGLVCGLGLRQVGRWQRGLIAGNGQAPRNDGR